MNIVTLSIAKKYVEETANALGAVKGANATIESVTPVEGGNNVVFAWTGADGTKHTHTLFVANGKEQQIKTVNGESMTGDGDISQAIIRLLVELGVYSEGESGGNTPPADGDGTEGDTPTDDNLATDEEVNDALGDIFGN